MTSFNLATKTARERTEFELDKAASLAIYKLRHAKTIILMRKGTPSDVGGRGISPGRQPRWF